LSKHPTAPLAPQNKNSELSFGEPAFCWTQGLLDGRMDAKFCKRGKMQINPCQKSL